MKRSITFRETLAEPLSRGDTPMSLRKTITDLFTILLLLAALGLFGGKHAAWADVEPVSSRVEADSYTRMDVFGVPIIDDGVPQHEEQGAYTFMLATESQSRVQRLLSGFPPKVCDDASSLSDVWIWWDDSPGEGGVYLRQETYGDRIHGDPGQEYFSVETETTASAEYTFTPEEDGLLRINYTVRDSWLGVPLPDPNNSPPYFEALELSVNGQTESIAPGFPPGGLEETVGSFQVPVVASAVSTFSVSSTLERPYSNGYFYAMGFREHNVQFDRLANISFEFTPADLGDLGYSNTWKEPESGDWSDGANWTFGVPPRPEDLVVFDSRLHNPYVTFESDVTTGPLFISGGLVDFNLGGNVYNVMPDDLGAEPTLQVVGRGWFRLANGTLSVGDVHVSGGIITLSPGARFVCDSGLIDGFGGSLFVGQEATCDVAADLVLAGGVNGDYRLLVDLGGAVSVGGALRIETDALFVGGAGTVNGTVMNADGLLILIGSLTIDGDYAQSANGTMRVFLDSEEYFRRLTVTGDVSLAGELAVWAEEDWVNGLTPGSTFLIMDIGGSRTGMFDRLAGGISIPGEPGWDGILTITYEAGDGNDIALIVIAEPFTLSSVASGNWNAATTWDCDTLTPTENYAAVVGNHRVTVAADGDALSLLIDPGEVVVGTGRTLTVVETVELAAGTLDIRGTVNAGAVQVAAGTLNVDGTLTATNVISEGTLSGSGTINADCQPAGIVSPGGAAGTGTLTLNGESEFGDDATYKCEVGALSNDKIHVGAYSGVWLAGNLDVKAIGVNSSEMGTTITRTILDTGTGGSIAGTFSEPATSGPDSHVGNGAFYRGSTTTTEKIDVELFVARGGDGNADTKVDTMDITNLVANFGLPGEMSWLENDTAGGTTGRGDGKVDTLDITDLVANFDAPTPDPGPAPEGSTNAGYNAGGGDFTVVPEPSTLVLLGMGAVGFLVYAWRRRRW